MDKKKNTKWFIILIKAVHLILEPLGNLMIRRSKSQSHSLKYKRRSAKNTYQKEAYQNKKIKCNRR